MLLTQVVNSFSSVCAICERQLRRGKVGLRTGFDQLACLPFAGAGICCSSITYEYGVFFLTLLGSEAGVYDGWWVTTRRELGPDIREVDIGEMR